MTKNEELEKLLEENKGNSRISENEEVLTSEDLNEIAEALEDGVNSGKYRGEVFATSGTTGKPTRAYFTESSLENIVERSSMSFIDTEEDKKFLNMFAGRPHISGWNLTQSVKARGAEALNDSYDDWQEVLDEGRSEEITDLGAVPTLAHKMAQIMRKELGKPPREIFPNLENAYFSGMKLSDDLRNTLKSEYGFDTQREFYASSEASAMGVSINPGSEHQIALPGYVLEIIPEDSEEPIDVRDIDKETKGVLLASDSSRRLFPNNVEEEDIPDGYSGDERFTRWYTGDKVKVTPDQEIAGLGKNANTFEVLGKEKFDLNMGGAVLGENEIRTSIVENYEDKGKIDWKAVKSREESEQGYGDLFLHIYVEDCSCLDYEGFSDSLYSNKSVKEADRKGVIKGIDFRPISNYDSQDNSMKGRNIIDET